MVISIEEVTSQRNGSMAEKVSAFVPMTLNGATAFFEVSILEGSLDDGEQQVAGLTDRFDFSKIQKSIEGVAKLIAESFKEVKPTKVAAELGLEFGLDSGKLTAVFVQGSGKANLKISLEWAAG